MASGCKPLERSLGNRVSRPHLGHIASTAIKISSNGQWLASTSNGGISDEEYKYCRWTGTHAGGGTRRSETGQQDQDGRRLRREQSTPLPALDHDEEGQAKGLRSRRPRLPRAGRPQGRGSRRRFRGELQGHNDEVARVELSLRDPGRVEGGSPSEVGKTVLETFPAPSLELIRVFRVRGNLAVSCCPLHVRPVKSSSRCVDQILDIGWPLTTCSKGELNRPARATS